MFSICAEHSLNWVKISASGVRHMCVLLRVNKCIPNLSRREVDNILMTQPHRISVYTLKKGIDAHPKVAKLDSISYLKQVGKAGKICCVLGAFLFYF